MFGITDLSTYIIGTVAVILLPGPNSMYCLAMAGKHGVKTAYRSVTGIFVGDSILLLAAALGAGTVLKTMPSLFHGIKLVGGLYLTYIGWNLLRGAAKKWHARREVVAVSAPIETEREYYAHGIFKRALLLSLTNPKAILFCLSFFVQFVGPKYPQPMLTFLALSVILQSLSFTYLSILVFAGNRLAHVFRQHQKVSSTAMALVGSLFIGFATKLLTATL